MLKFNVSPQFSDFLSPAYRTRFSVKNPTPCRRPSTMVYVFIEKKPNSRLRYKEDVKKRFAFRCRYRSFSSHHTRIDCPGQWLLLWLLLATMENAKIMASFIKRDKFGRQSRSTCEAMTGRWTFNVI